MVERWGSLEYLQLHIEGEEFLVLLLLKLLGLLILLHGFEGAKFTVVLHLAARHPVLLCYYACLSLF